MKIAIISDIHDHRRKLQLALAQIQQTDLLLCLGDLCSPFIMKDLGEGYKKTIHVVFGNNDGDLFRLTNTANQFKHIELHGEVADLLIAGKKFVLTHFDKMAEMLSTSDHYDVICFGHNHRYQVEMRGATLIINPGEVMGELTGTSSLVIFDTETGETTKFEF